ncbi:replication protein A 70 kDa DNA-binding subunit A-like [Rosa chinensis]|uniref:replication protein A 70 kDa DNA-binding subunit A-like n=1 Tax=Rosa chinensis TaxID=74649 RepID=UPI000D08A613|nr:replication protein A 70 kDa DNA-binding subunit A-like [Rosa chinensis]
MDARLTEGAILKITTDFVDDNYKPILQVIGLKQIHTHGGGWGGQVTERYRVTVSDGSHTKQGMLLAHQNFLVQQGHLQKGSVVRLNQFTCPTIQGRKIIIIISLNVLVDKCDIIGQAARFSNAQSPGTILVDETTEQFASFGL